MLSMFTRKLYGEQAKYFEMEAKPRIKHKKKGTVSMVNNGSDMHGSQVRVFGIGRDSTVKSVFYGQCCATTSHLRPFSSQDSV